ncbi:DUF7373 family lipoprotein [Tsukamurella paurometabola]|uniref:DUF7373 domain-containing protein n=1 Tax=Tsukamurella paurometabola TaxID=2061 RepID=A0ABS5N6N8_TSUPA|nr:hypothetical protein [Tsukamurella paurometabola]MBS4099935.1 hypothetical protein [Tsukamurella paurometabola]
MPELRARRAPALQRAAALALGGLIAVSCTACTRVIAGTASAPPEVTRLDTGNYPTAPRTVEAKASADAWQQEGWRVADAVVAPWEVDPRATAAPESGPPVLPLFQAQALGTEAGAGLVTSEQAQSFITAPFHTGFLATRTARDRSVTVQTGVLRFPDEATARRAIDGAAQKNPTRDDAVSSAVSAIPGGTIVLYGDVPGATRLTAAAIRGDLVALASVEMPQTGRDGLTARVVAGLAEQVERLPKYVPTPRNPSSFVPPVPMDKEGILSRTIASRSDDASYGLSAEFTLGDGYMSAYAFSLMIYEPRSLQEEYGLDLAGHTSVNGVLRMRSAADSLRYLADYRKRAGTGEALSSIPGIPAGASVCSPTLCLTSYGRYVGLNAFASITQSKQAAAAQYLILEAAGT